MHFEIAIERVLHKISKITASLADHLNLQEKVAHTDSVCVKSSKRK